MADVASSPSAWAGALTRTREGIRRAVSTGLARRGLELTERRGPEPLEEEFLEAYASCAPFTMTSRERMYGLWQATRHVVATGVPGDIVECGVWRGGSSMLAALTLERHDTDHRRVWLYDTFEGMAEPGPQDVAGALGENPQATWRAAQGKDHNAWCYSPLEDVTRNLTRIGVREERFVCVKGKVEDTIPQQAPEKIALLRLDTDWHDSTRHELVNLYPRLSPGGVLIIDDYGHWAGARRAVDDYLMELGTPLLLARLDETGRMAVKPWSAQAAADRSTDVEPS